MIRRGFLRWMLSTAAMIWPIPAGLPAGTSSVSVARNLKELLADCESARAIGRVCLATRSTEADSGALIRRLAADDVSIDAPIPLVSLARYRLRTRIRQDFADGRIAVVNGWHMSVTEVRLYALAALL
jgi:hypothetical protein